MDFSFTETQQEISLSVVEVIKSIANGPDRESQLRGALQEIGAFSLLLPEEDGGLGFGMIEVAAVLEAIGSIGPSAPWVEELCAIPVLLRSLSAGNGSVAHLLDSYREGVSLGFASDIRDPSQVVSRGAGHEGVLVIVDGNLNFASGDALSTTSRLALNGENPVTSFSLSQAITLTRVSQELEGEVTSSCLIASAAILLGAGRASLENAVEHAKHREQFGRPVGAFQAVKHLLADAEIALTLARPLVYGAAIAVDRHSSMMGRDAVTAYLTASEAAMTAVQNSLQVHGAIGYTEEGGIGRLLSCAVGEAAVWKNGSALAATWADAMLRESWHTNVAEDSEVT